MRNRVMQIFDIATVVLLLAAAATFLTTFLIAYFNGMQVVVTINDCGEANAELVMISLSVLCGFVTLFRMLRRL